MNFIEAKLKNFVEARLNQDSLCNLVFWLGMTCWVYFTPEHTVLTLSSFFCMPYLIRKFFPLTVVEQRAELLLEFPDSASFEANSQEKEVKEELPATRECLANSQGKIVSDGAPYLFCVALSPLAIGVPLFMIIWNGLHIDLPAFVWVAIFFLIPVSIFELCDRPISLLFDWRAWYLQGWRAVRRGSSSNNSSDPFSNSSDKYYSPSYSYLSNNIHNHHR